MVALFLQVNTKLMLIYSEKHRKKNSSHGRFSTNFFHKKALLVLPFANHMSTCFNEVDLHLNVLCELPDC
jgi:hypothetical protein